MNCPRLAVEDEQGVVHVLPVVAVVGAPFLLPMRRIVRAVQIEHDVRRHALPFPLRQVDRAQGLGQAVAVPRRERILEAREGRLAGQVGVGLPASRPQTSFSSGSVRKVSASSWSS